MLQSLLWWEVGVDKSEHILTVTWETVVLFVFLTSTCKLQGLEIQPPTLWLMDDCSKAWATGQPIWICCYNAMFSWEALVPDIQVRYFDTHHQVHLLTATELRDGSGQRSKTMLYPTRGICQRAQGRPPNFIYAIWSRIQGMCWNKSNPWKPIPWCQKPKNTGTVSLHLQVSSLIHNGSSMDWTSSTDAQSNWDLGNPETKLMPWAIQSSFSVVWQGALSFWEDCYLLVLLMLCGAYTVELLSCWMSRFRWLARARNCGLARSE